MAYIFGEKDDEEDSDWEDILQAWLNKNKPTLDECGWPNTHIAAEMDAYVGDFRQSKSGRSKDVGSIEGTTPRPEDYIIASTQSTSLDNDNDSDVVQEEVMTMMV